MGKKDTDSFAEAEQFGLPPANDPRVLTQAQKLVELGLTESEANSIARQWLFKPPADPAQYQKWVELAQRREDQSRLRKK